MERTLVKETVNKVGEKVTLAGWVNTIRDHGKITFIDLRDRSGIVQCVGKDLTKVNPESVVEISGLVKKRPENLVNPRMETGTIEIEIENLNILSKSAELPFDMGVENLELELPTLLDYRSLTLRHPKIKAIFKVQEVVVDAFRRALFRAEPSVTTRHLTEVISLDAEFGFIKDYLEVKGMAEYVIKFILKEVDEKCKKELAMYNATTPSVAENIPIIKLRDAQQTIFERTGRDVRREKDLAPDDEREICLWSKEVHGSDLVFVSHYPTYARPFYTYPDPDEPEYNQGFDLIGRGTEWMTGGRRIHDYDTLVEHAKKWGVTPENIEL